MYPLLWELSGVPLPQLCDRLLTLGLDRHRRRGELDSSLQAFVKSASQGQV